MKIYKPLSVISFPQIVALQFFYQASVTVLILAILVPPFENPDEFNHANRVDEIASGGLIATRYRGPQTSGGTVDVGINLIDTRIGIVRFHPERKVTRAMMLDANAVRWGTRASTTFANTSIYAPFLYVPSVVGLWIGKLLGLSITRTLIISRAANGLTCVLAGSLAMAFADEAAFFLLVVLSLPMSIFLFSSVSQDGAMLALSAGAVTLISILQKDPRARSLPCLIALGICLALIGLGRPAYAVFCVIPLLLKSPGWRVRILVTAAALLAIASWSFLTVRWTMINAVAFRGVNPEAQLSFLASHPATWWKLAVSVVTGAQGMEGSSFYRETVGILGWQDVVLPGPFYILSGCALVAAVIVTLPRNKPLLAALAQGAAFASGLGAIILVFLLEYISWTPVGFPIIQGVQGRYFLPILLFLPCMLPMVRSTTLSRLCTPVRTALLFFPMVSFAVTVATVVHRYYL